MARTVEQVLERTEKKTAPKADISYMEQALKDQTEAAKQQAQAQIDRGVAEGTAELERAAQQAEEGFQAQREQIDLDEAMSRDAQALYAELRGDRGGIGAAQYDAIANTAAENRLAVAQAQRQAAAQTAEKIAALRSQGEYEKADKVLSLTQEYLGKLTDLQKWAAEYDLSAAKFTESVNQWQQEYAQKQAQLEDENSRQAAKLDYDTRQKNLRQTGKILLESGILPSESQLSALGMTEQQARAYMAAVKAQQAVKASASAGKSSGSSGSGSSGSSGSGNSGSGSSGSSGGTAAQSSGGEYALYLAARDSGGDPRTYVKNHYKEYGLTVLPTEKAYQTWEKRLKQPLGAAGFETFLGKLNISLSEDTQAAADYFTAKYWPTLTAAQRAKAQSLYRSYGMTYRYSG